MERKDLLYLGAFALLLFLFGSWLMPVTDPVESNYVETAKEMIAAGDYLSPRSTAYRILQYRFCRSLST